MASTTSGALLRLALSFEVLAACFRASVKISSVENPINRRPFAANLEPAS